MEANTLLVEHEIWFRIDNCFAVSNKGRVKSLARDVPNHTGIIHKPERILKLQTDHKGYARVSLGKRKTLAVHRLVAKSFIPNPQNKPQVNHIDGNKQNNCVENLEWCTNQENQIHAIKTGLNDHSKYHSGRPYKPVIQIDLLTNEIIATYKSITDAKKAVSPNSTHNNIAMCCRGLRHSAFGFKWRFENAE